MIIVGDQKKIRYFFAISFLCWLFPFVLRILFVNIPEIGTGQTKFQNPDNQNIVNDIIQSLDTNDNGKTFSLIFSNNIKGCIINIVGGVLLGLGTFINLLFNGFFSADIFVSSYKAGISTESILKVTLPHSFELIGFWLSGAIGFYITWNIMRFMRGKEAFTNHFYKQVGIYSIVICFIILAAACVESYTLVNISQ
jgi:uncharacterized membrane protein SpoIIM required for sporulation